MNALKQLSLKVHEHIPKLCSSWLFELASVHKLDDNHFKDHHSKQVFAKLGLIEDVYYLLNLVSLSLEHLVRIFLVSRPGEGIESLVEELVKAFPKKFTCLLLESKAVLFVPGFIHSKVLDNLFIVFNHLCVGSEVSFILVQVKFYCRRVVTLWSSRLYNLSLRRLWFCLLSCLLCC